MCDFLTCPLPLHLKCPLKCWSWRPLEMQYEGGENAMICGTNPFFFQCLNCLSVRWNSLAALLSGLASVPGHILLESQGQKLHLCKARKSLRWFFPQELKDTLWSQTFQKDLLGEVFQLWIRGLSCCTQNYISGTVGCKVSYLCITDN